MSKTPSDPIYTPEQLEQYFDYIKFPKNERIPPEQTDTAAGLDFLSKLVKYQICHIPFENLDLHYASNRGISLDRDHLFHKIVGRGVGRGGYCMQNNSFFATILRSLGYNCLTAGARVSKDFNGPNAGKEDPGNVMFGGWAHQTNIITIEGKKYSVDVGFGAAGPTFPIPMEDGFTAPNTGDGKTIASRILLRKMHIANNTTRNPEQLVWVYMIAYGSDPDANWIPGYCFVETEFFDDDFTVMSHHVSTSPTSVFVNLILCSKFIMDEDENVVGDITLAANEMKKRVLGKSDPVAEIRTEQDRTQALEKYMGLTLSDAEKSGIAGLPTELKGQ